jgi:hypothetical protein
MIKVEEKTVGERVITAEEKEQLGKEWLRWKKSTVGKGMIKV